MTVVIALLNWVAHRNDGLRIRPSDTEPPDYEAYRNQHDLDAIRTRFS